MDNKTPQTMPKMAITVTFSYLKNVTPYGQFKEVIPKLTKLLSESTEFELIPEWTPTDARVHVHGTVEVLDKYKWITTTLPAMKRMGFIKVKKIDNLEKWKTYFYKDKWLAEKITKLEMPMTKEVIVVKTKKKIDIPDSEDAVKEEEYLDMKEQA